MKLQQLVEEIKQALIEHLNQCEGSFFLLNQERQREIIEMSPNVEKLSSLRIRKKISKINDNNFTIGNAGVNNKEGLDDNYWDLINRLKARIRETENLADLSQTLRFVYQGFSLKTKEFGQAPFYSSVLVNKGLGKELLIFYQNRVNEKFRSYPKLVWKESLELSTEQDWFDFVHTITSKMNARRAFKIYWGIYLGILQHESNDLNRKPPESRAEKFKLLTIKSERGKIRLNPLSQLFEPPFFYLENLISRESLKKRIFEVCTLRKLKPKIRCTIKEAVDLMQIVQCIVNDSTNMLIDDMEGFVKTNLLCNDSVHDNINCTYTFSIDNASEFILVIRSLFEGTSFFETKERDEIKVWLEFLLQSQSKYHPKTIEAYFDYERIRERNLTRYCKKLEVKLKGKLPKSISSIPPIKRRRRDFRVGSQKSVRVIAPSQHV